VFCGKDGCRRADALEGEASEGFQDYGDAGGYQHDSDCAEGREAQEWWAEAPVGDPPRDESGDGSGGEHKESCCSEDGERLSGSIGRFPRMLHWVSLVAIGSLLKNGAE
jgi:hypothetical protein